MKRGRQGKTIHYNAIQKLMSVPEDTIQRCTRCILPASLHHISFDEQGVCNHCRQYEKNFREWNSIKEEREKQFESLIEKARVLKRPYDCLVPLSGGKDSTYTLYLANRVYGLKTLAITFDHGYLSGQARENIQNALKSCRADHLYYSVNRLNSSQLFKVFAEKTADFCSACMRGINYSIEQAVKAFRIPLIIKGSGRRVQYTSQIEDVTSVNTPSYFGKVLKGSEAAHAFSHFSRNKHRLEFQKIVGGVCDIMGLSRSVMMRFMPQHIGIYDYIYKPFPEIIDIIKTKMHWNDGGGTSEHLDCRMHDVPFYHDTLRIPNITKYTFYNSGLIRQGLITREAALEQESKELASHSVPPELLEFLEEHDLDLDRYETAVKTIDRSVYEPSIQKIARRIYHRFRKF